MSFAEMISDVVDLQIETFGTETPATYTLVAGAGSSLEGIFDKPHVSVDIGERSVSDLQPVFRCKTSSLPAGAAGGSAGDTLLVDGITYRVLDLEPDGQQGMTRIVLGR